MSEKKKRREYSRREVLAFMASLSLGANKIPAAESYIIELLACMAFAPWDETATYITS